MKILIKINICIILFTLTSFQSEAKGRDVIIFLKDSTEVKGELLAVRDSLVALAIQPISQDEEIVVYQDRVKIVRFHDISIIEIHESSKVVQGILIGGLGGGLIGVMINQSGGFFKKGDFPIILPTLAGGLAGLLAGYIVSDGQESFEFLENGSVRIIKDGFKGKATLKTALSLLKKHSRFNESEPSYLHDTIDNLLKETK
jgi:hypothetical protein